MSAPSPWRPGAAIEILAGTPEGGGQDRVARAVATALRPAVPVPIEVTNIPGRGGGNAWDELVSHPGDGHCVSISSPTLITNRVTGAANLDYRDVTHVALLATEFIMFAVRAGSPIASARELLDRIATSATVTVALATGLGNVNHIAVAQIWAAANRDPATCEVHVFDSARFAVADVVGGAADVVAVSGASVLPEARTGELRLLAVSAPQRLAPPLDAVPTWEELGVDCAIGTWRGIVAPPALDPAPRRYWRETIAAAVRSHEWRQAVARNLWTETYLDSSEALEFLDRQAIEMRAALTQLGLLT